MARAKFKLDDRVKYGDLEGRITRVDEDGGVFVRWLNVSGGSALGPKAAGLLSVIPEGRAG